MENQKKAKIKFYSGIGLIIIVTIIGIIIGRQVSMDTAPEVGYIYVTGPIVVGIILGLFGKLLVLSGYKKLSE